MKRTIAIVLTLLGVGIMLYGGFVALSALASMYQGALADAMNQPEGTEKSTSDAMLRGVLIGAPGAVLFVVGSVMLKAAMFHKPKERR